MTKMKLNLRMKKITIFRRIKRLLRRAKYRRKIPIKIEIDRKDKSDDDYDSKKIDSILDKISSKGYENLTETEKRILENYSKDTKKH